MNECKRGVEPIREQAEVPGFREALSWPLKAGPFLTDCFPGAGEGGTNVDKLFLRNLTQQRLDTEGMERGVWTAMGEDIELLQIRKHLVDFTLLSGGRENPVTPGR